MYQFWLVLCQLTVWTSPADTLLGLTLTLSTVGVESSTVNGGEKPPAEDVGVFHTATLIVYWTGASCDGMVH